MVQGHATEEKLISAAKEVAASTAQLLVASKVRADADSLAMRRLQVSDRGVLKKELLNKSLNFKWYCYQTPLVSQLKISAVILPHYMYIIQHYIHSYSICGPHKGKGIYCSTAIMVTTRTTFYIIHC